MNVVTCPSCNFANPLGNRYCNACGAELASTPLGQPVQPTTPPPPEVPAEYTPPMDAERAAALGAGTPSDAPNTRFAPPPPPPIGTTSSTNQSMSKMLAAVVEFVPGVFGLWGVGWLMAGNRTMGIILLVISLGVALTVGLPLLLADIFTFGAFLFIHIPIHLFCVTPIALISAGALYYNLRENANFN